MLRHVKRMPRTAGVIIWTAGAVAMYAAVPAELSRLGDRARPQGPAASTARSAGLLTVTAGAALMTWAMATHHQAVQQGWTLDSRLTPQLPAAPRTVPVQPQPDLCRRSHLLVRLGTVLPPPGRLGRAGDP